MDDEQLEETLLAAAREYHLPPEPPRDAMWQAIEAARRADRIHTPARRWIPWAVAAAAVLGTGIGIGRLSTPGGRGSRPEAAPMVGATSAPRSSETAYRLATLDHLAQSEVFLTLFRASLRAGTRERLAPATARQLLATNRLLLDSPAGQNRKTRVLLEDLELELAEIAQLSPESPRDDRELLREGIDRDGVLSRLQTVVPAGMTPTRGDL
jgi:hypothetical protein